MDKQYHYLGIFCWHAFNDGVDVLNIIMKMRGSKNVKRCADDYMGA